MERGRSAVPRPLMGLLFYSPLARGWLSGRYRRGSVEGPTSEARKRLANRFDLELPPPWP